MHNPLDYLEVILEWESLKMNSVFILHICLISDIIYKSKFYCLIISDLINDVIFVRISFF